MAPAVREQCRAALVAFPADPVVAPACPRAAQVVLRDPGPVDVPVDLAVPVAAVPADLVAPVGPVAAVLVAPVDLAVPVAAVPVDLVGPVVPAAPRDPTTAVPRLPRPPPCGWRPPRGAAPPA
ncbi:hypothetical protein [Amycolatopsis sp. NPDC051371]|uniref:hypothetical protein n=1 Tax=Amycolatopsis sp. NPDC051371 TaxID=3155800 RepID=UPI00342B6764